MKPLILVDHAYETINGSKVLITKKINSNLYEGIIIPNNKFGLLKYKKYKTFNDLGECHNIPEYEIQKRIPKKEIDVILRHCT